MAQLCSCLLFFIILPRYQVHVTIFLTIRRLCQSLRMSLLSHVVETAPCKARGKKCMPLIKTCVSLVALNCIADVPAAL